MTPFATRDPDSTIFERNWPTFAITLVAIVGGCLVAFVDAAHITAVVTFMGPLTAILIMAWRQKQTHDILESHGEQLSEIHQLANSTATAAIVEAKTQNLAIGVLEQTVRDQADKSFKAGGDVERANPTSPK